MTNAVDVPAALDRRGALLVVLLAVAASAPSLANGFAYDDRWIIVENVRIQSLGRWADWFRTSYWPTVEATLYRPLTTAGFAVQWAAGGGEPWIFHLVNVALYACAAVAFYWLASLCLAPTGALVAGAIFAVHPVHVEAVANAVGQSELSAGLTMLCATAVYIRARRARPPAASGSDHADDGRGGFPRVTSIGLVALYLVAVLLKEHALVLPAWLLAAEATVLRASGAWRTRIRVLAPFYAQLAVVAAFALVVRHDVLGGVAGDIPHPVLLELGVRERAHVMLGIVPELARLLLWPARLYADYSPQFVTVFPGPDVSQLNGVAILAGVALLGVLSWRRSPVVSFGLLLAAFVWLPTSNVLFPSGVLLAERTLFLPSAGVLLALGTAVPWVEARTSAHTRWRAAVGAVFAVLLCAGVARSVTRTRVWRSSDEVFATMIRDQPTSFRAQHAWGGVLFERGDLAGGERAWRTAIALFPAYHKVYQDLAGAYASNRLCQPAIPLYEKALEIGGRLPLARAGLVACQLQLARFSEARATARQGIADGNDPAWFRARLFSADSALAANDSLRR